MEGGGFMGREMRGVKGDQKKRKDSDAAWVELRRRGGLGGGEGGQRTFFFFLQKT